MTKQHLFPNLERFKKALQFDALKTTGLEPVIVVELIGKNQFHEGQGSKLHAN